ncbi:oligosaccharide flippase family protein [Bacteroides thetaiotaomicron]|nr:oligosaccharide flippase family protein [Bacteroides thetaiotaomicron]
MSDSKQSTYRSIFKATSLFGGLQLYLIFISIIKSKFIAILLGPLGVGIQGLFQSGTEVIRTLTNFGLSQSAVREVSEANGNKDEVRIKLVTSVINKLVWITGLLGAILVCILSPYLSQSLFGNYDYTVPFYTSVCYSVVRTTLSRSKSYSSGAEKNKRTCKSISMGFYSRIVGVNSNLLFIWSERYCTDVNIKFCYYVFAFLVLCKALYKKLVLKSQ